MISLIKSDNKGFESFSYTAFVLDGMTVASGVVSQAREKQHNRQMVNKQLENIFAKAGVSIPKNESFLFTVTEDQYIHVKGGDEVLTKRMEAALNQGDTGYQLATHLKLSGANSQAGMGEDDIRNRMLYRNI